MVDGQFADTQGYTRRCVVVHTNLLRSGNIATPSPPRTGVVVYVGPPCFHSSIDVTCDTYRMRERSYRSVEGSAHRRARDGGALVRVAVMVLSEHKKAEALLFGAPRLRRATDCSLPSQRPSFANTYCSSQIGEVVAVSQVFGTCPTHLGQRFGNEEVCDKPSNGLAFSCRERAGTSLSKTARSRAKRSTAMPYWAETR